MNCGRGHGKGWPCIGVLTLSPTTHGENMTMKDGKPFRGLIDTLKEENAALRKEVERLEEWKRDVEETHISIVSEDCEDDKRFPMKHCTCVPALRTRIAALKKAGDAYIKIHPCTYFDPDCEGSLADKGDVCEEKQAWDKAKSGEEE